MKIADLHKRFIDKVQAFRVARQSSDLKSLAVYKNHGVETNTHLSAKERDRRKKHRKMAKLSRIQNWK